MSVIINIQLDVNSPVKEIGVVGIVSFEIYFKAEYKGFWVYINRIRENRRFLVQGGIDSGDYCFESVSEAEDWIKNNRKSWSKFNMTDDDFTELLQ